MSGLRKLAAAAYVLCVTCCAPRTVFAQATEAEAPIEALASTAGETIAATANGDVVYADEVEIALARSLGSRAIDRRSRYLIAARTLDQLIGRRLIEAYLIEQGLGPSQQEIDAEIERLRSELEGRQLSLEDFLSQRQVDFGQFRQRLARRLAWKIGWPQYLESQSTPERMAEFFEAHRCQYDGTEVRASHVLIRVDRTSGPNAVAEAMKRAKEIRDQITTGELSLAEAAEQYSDGPSRRHGGDLGFFPRRGVMHERFSAAAFALDDGEISEPVLTPFGVHLIQRTDIKEGTKTFAEFREEMTPLDRHLFDTQLTQDVFFELARRQRAVAQVEFTGAVPFIKPGTSQLVIPRRLLESAGAETTQDEEVPAAEVEDAEP